MLDFIPLTQKNRCHPDWPLITFPILIVPLSPTVVMLLAASLDMVTLTNYSFILQLTPLHFTIAVPWWLMSLHSDSESLTNIWLIIDHVNQAEARPRLGTGRSQLQQWLFSWTEIYAVYWEGTVKRRINLNQQVGGLFWCRSVSYFSLVWEWDRRALVQHLISLL